MLDIKKNYFGHFPEFDDAVRTIGTQVIPIFEKGKRIRKVPVTVLESKEVKESWRWPWSASAAPRC